MALWESLRWAALVVLFFQTEIGEGWVRSNSFSNNYVLCLEATTPNQRGNQHHSYSTLPAGLSPFEKSVAKSINVQANLRGIAARALQRALQDNKNLLEMDFPCLVGGEDSRTQFDDFDNIQELNANRDWCTQFAPMILTPFRTTTTWLVFPDDKECELAKRAWTGQMYRNAAKFTSLRAACAHVSMMRSGNGGDKAQFAKAWGSTLAAFMDKLQGGDGILADSSALDDLTEDTDADSPPSSSPSHHRLHLICQPGNGGPVEDWINVQKLHQASDPLSTTTLIVNGALDKVRDGYYPSVFFPALASTVPFYKQFEPVLYLKPLTDKGLYGWLYRVYPEPWQVIAQIKSTVQSRSGVQERVVLVSHTRPSYAHAIRALSSSLNDV